MKSYKTTFLFCVFFLSFIACQKEKKSIDFNSFNSGDKSSIEHSSGYDLMERMEYYDVPGVSIAVVRNGQMAWAKGYGIANEENGEKVHPETLFQAGSISKPLAALAALQLLEKGKVSLSEDVNRYLQNWRIEDNEFTIQEKITLERLLTHTAGVTVHGFPGYKQGEKMPTIEEVLSGKGNTNKVEVYTTPGSKWKYSGGGYTIMESVVEDISGLPLEEYMDNHIFLPIEMFNSTFEQPLSSAHSSKASAGHNSRGNAIPGLWNNYPEQAAAGLWTTPTDLAKYCIEIHEILSCKKQGVLAKETVELMLTKHKKEWGLGPRLDKQGDSLLFGHGGKNKGFTNHFVSFAHLGNALIIMTNGDSGQGLINEIQESIFNVYQW